MPRLLVFMLGFLSSLFGVFVILLFVTAPTWAFTWMIMHLTTLPILMFNLDRAWGHKLLSFVIPHTQLVRIMDHDGEIRHVLAYGEPDHVLEGHIYWLAEIGSLKLYPNGYVAGTSYVYFWEPVDVDARTAMHLTYDCVDWSKLKHMNWHEVEEYRFKLRNQAKLMNVTHI